MLKRFAVVLAGLGLLSACGGGNDPIKLMGDMADKVCACKDMACVEQVQKDFAAKGEEMKKNLKPEDITPEMGQKMMELTGKIAECTTKLTAGGGEPAPAPAPEGGEAH